MDLLMDQGMDDMTDRWICMYIKKSNDGTIFIFKRISLDITYLSITYHDAVELQNVVYLLMETIAICFHALYPQHKSLSRIMIP